MHEWDHSLFEGVGKALDVFSVKVGCRFVESKNATIETERLGESETDDERRENFLPGRTSTSHLQLRLPLLHYNPVVVVSSRSRSRRLRLFRLNANRVDV